jgi:riboflavin transporter FmnP
MALNARSAALIGIFSALAIVLNAIKIPTFYWPNFFYSFYEIPVLVAFIIYGFKIGFLVEIVHIMGQEIFFPMGAAGAVVYPMGLIVHLFMFSGIYLANNLIHRKNAKGKLVSEKKTAIYFTGLATALRGGLMPIIDYTVMYSILLPFALGTTIPETYILALVPAFILYNVTSTLYAVPIAHLIAKKTAKNLRIEAKFLYSAHRK